MHIIFILFFSSLLGIIIMIGRKMRLAETLIEVEGDHPLIQDVERVKDFLYRHTRKLGYVALVTAIRLHLKSSKLAREKYSELKMKVKNKLMKEPGEGGKMEASGFIKMITEYKHKVKRVAREIHEEEN